MHVKYVVQCSGHKRCSINHMVEADKLLYSKNGTCKGWKLAELCNMADCIFKKYHIISHPMYLYVLFYSMTLILFPLRGPMFPSLESGQVYDYNESDHFVNSKINQ